LKFEYIPTQAMGARPILKKRPFVTKLVDQGLAIGARNVADLDAGSVFPGYKARSFLDLVAPCRQFDSYQRTSYFDCAFQPGSIDKVTLFGLRPPELRFVNRMTKFWTFFTRDVIKDYSSAKDIDSQTTVVHCLLDADYSRCAWIDAMGYRIRVRKLAVPKVLKCLEAYQLGGENERMIGLDFGSIQLYECTVQLFKRLDE
jgi:hypothetical protein